MTALTACLDAREINLLKPFSLKKNEKPNLSKTFDFLQTEDDKLTQTLNGIVEGLEKIREDILEKKIPLEHCQKFHKETTLLSGGLKSVIEAISNFKVDDITIIKVIETLKQLQSVLSEIKDISGVYADVHQSEEDFKNGNILTHEQVWGKK